MTGPPNIHRGRWHSGLATVQRHVLGYVAGDGAEHLGGVPRRLLWGLTMVHDDELLVNIG